VLRTRCASLLAEVHPAMRAVAHGSRSVQGGVCAPWSPRTGGWKDDPHSRRRWASGVSRPPATPVSGAPISIQPFQLITAAASDSGHPAAARRRRRQYFIHANTVRRLPRRSASLGPLIHHYASRGRECLSHSCVHRTCSAYGRPVCGSSNVTTEPDSIAFTHGPENEMELDSKGDIP
jgi:hypothetical protein